MFIAVIHYTVFRLNFQYFQFNLFIKKNEIQQIHRYIFNIFELFTTTKCKYFVRKRLDKFSNFKIKNDFYR